MINNDDDDDDDDESPRIGNRLKIKNRNEQRETKKAE